MMTVRRRIRLSLLLALCALVVLSAGCGGKGGASQSDTSNFGCREALAAALAADGSLDANARSLIQSVAAGQYDLQKCLDELVAQDGQILAQISKVASSPKPSNSSLAQARQQTEEYLRNRIFQIESALGAQSPAQLQALYDANAATLAASRASITDLLQKYQK